MLRVSVGLLLIWVQKWCRRKGRQEHPIFMGLERYCMKWLLGSCHFMKKIMKNYMTKYKTLVLVFLNMWVPNVETLSKYWILFIVEIDGQGSWKQDRSWWQVGNLLASFLLRNGFWFIVLKEVLTSLVGVHFEHGWSIGLVEWRCSYCYLF